MATDKYDRDVNEAMIYVTGYAGIAPVEAGNVITAEKLGAKQLTIPAGFKFLGLRTSDGGPEQSRDTGDAIEFLEDGFTINSDGAISVKMTLAQYNATVRGVVLGAEPDKNGVIKVKDTTPSSQYILLLESMYKSGAIKREHGVARVSEVAPGKDERGTTNGTEVTFEWVRSDLFDGAYYWEAYLSTGTSAGAASSSRS